MDGRLKNTHAIKVVCVFRPISILYPRNAYTLAAIATYIYSLIIQNNKVLDI